MQFIARYFSLVFTQSPKSSGSIGSVSYMQNQGKIIYDKKQEIH